MSNGYGPIIREYRKSLGLSLKDFGNRISISRSALGNAELEKTNLGQGALRTIVREFPALRNPLAPYIHEVEEVSAEFVDDDDWFDDEGVDHHEASSELRRELRGEWFALWQTSVHGKENRNSEEIDIRWRFKTLHFRNRAVSKENPEGGYIWEAQCRLYDNRYILGTYVARDGITRSKGTMYLVLHTSGRFIHGHWVGCNYDHDWAEGLVAFSRSRDDLEVKLENHLRSRPLMPYNIEEGRRK